MSNFQSEQINSIMAKLLVIIKQLRNCILTARPSLSKQPGWDLVEIISRYKTNSF